ncbi:hypothetical protein BOFL111202_17580 [Bordetella flabilis]
MLTRTSGSSWGHPRREIDTRGLRRFCRLLSAVAQAGELLNPILLCLLLLLTAWLLAFSNLENISFYDGTATVCVLDGTTQRLPHVR